MTSETRRAMQHSLDSDAPIQIISGEGERGSVETYTGKRTTRALLSRLTIERCHGDRWARAVVYSHANKHGEVGIRMESGEYDTWHAIGA